MTGLIRGLVGSPDPVAAPTPTPVAPPPDRSDADIQAAGLAQRSRYFGAQKGVDATSFTGGVGTTQGSSNVVSFLGNVGR